MTYPSASPSGVPFWIFFGSSPLPVLEVIPSICFMKAADKLQQEVYRLI
jgi:hypothetical protein